MKISLVAAVAQNYAIGKDNRMLWHLPRDLKYFKQLTLHHVVIMGRKTFISIGSKPLAERTNIVLSRDVSFQSSGVLVVGSLEEALSLAQKISPQEEIFIIGGAELYRQSLPLAHRLYITEVHAVLEGDTFFPTISPKEWREISRLHHAKDDKNSYPLDFVVYERVA